MPASVRLHVQNPDGSSHVFRLTGHDTFLLGRMEDCHFYPPDAGKLLAVLSKAKP